MVMSEEPFNTIKTAAEPSLCGFHRCRAPLPPPGPRGGRPFEFCPDRRWPGDKTCKQLAAADQAIREALGEVTAPGALQDATSAFVHAAKELGAPLQNLSHSLDTATARINDTVAGTLARAQQAEAQAAEADQRCHAAEEHAAQAEQTARAAEEHAQRQEQTAADALAHAKEAIAARKEGELGQARAEAAAAAATKQATAAFEDARAERGRADQIGANLAERNKELAVRTTERDIALDALAELRDRSSEIEQALRAQLELTAAERANDHLHLREIEERLRTTLREQHQAALAQAKAQAQARTDTALAAAQLDESRRKADRIAQLNDDLNARLVRVHRLVLDDAPDQDSDLRSRLLAELLHLPGTS
jgi:hypothetical protein